MVLWKEIQNKMRSERLPGPNNLTGEGRHDFGGQTRKLPSQETTGKYSHKTSDTESIIRTHEWWPFKYYDICSKWLGTDWAYLRGKVQKYQNTQKNYWANFQGNTTIIHEYIGLVCTLGKGAEENCGIRTVRAAIARTKYINGTQEEHIVSRPG